MTSQKKRFKVFNEGTGVVLDILGSLINLFSFNYKNLIV